jgi:hypothetical protein
LFLIGTLLSLYPQSSQRPTPFASIAVGPGATSGWHKGAGDAESEGQIEDSAPSAEASALAGLLVGRSVRVGAVGDLLWIAAGDQEPDLVILAGVYLEYAFPPGLYYLFGEAGVCWHVVDPGDSSAAGWGPGFALGAGYRLTRLLALQAKCSFSGYDEAGDGDGRYRHLALLAELRLMLE